MSPVLALNYDGSTPYQHMLPEVANELVVLSHEPLDDPKGLLHYEYIPGLEGSAEGLKRAEQLHQRFRFDHVITDNEYEIERCALLRERWGLPGQDVESARAFRDKLVMKSLAKAAVRVPDAISIRTEKCLLRFADQVGLPIVVKPVDQGGSREVEIIRSREALHDYRIATTYRMEAEEYIEGDVHHIDALSIDGHIRFACASQYSVPPTEFLKGKTLAHLQYAPNEPQSKEMYDFLHRLLSRMPSPANSAYHLEVIRDHSNGQLVLCEIASRVGGAQIPELIERTFGIDLQCEAFRAQLGLGSDLNISYAGKVHASVIWPSLGGTFDAPAEPPYPWVLDYVFRRQPKHPVEPSRHSNDHVARAVIEAPSHAELVQRSNELDAWMRQHWNWHTE